MKKCNKCKVEKELTEFYSQQQKGKEGQIWKYHDSYCKPCRIQYTNERNKLVKLKAIHKLARSI